MHTTPCRLKTQTPEQMKRVCKKLEELGYIPVLVEEDTILYTFRKKNGWFFTTTNHLLRKAPQHDCGENEALFLALAALRDDSDYMQWFVCLTNGAFQQCIQRYWHDDQYLSELWRKATKEELVEHFKE